MRNCNDAGDAVSQQREMWIQTINGRGEVEKKESTAFYDLK